MAWISNGCVALENGASIHFDEIFPVKIIYPMVLMSNSTVYNLILNAFVTENNGTKVNNINNIIYAWCTRIHKPFVCLKIENNTYIIHNDNTISDPFSENKMIEEINFLIVDGNISDNMIIYTSDNMIMIKNSFVHTLIDIDCQHIQTNIIGNILEIYLLKNNDIILYHFDIATNICEAKKKYILGFDVYKTVNNYLIGHDGSVYRVDINCVDNEQITVLEMETTYKIRDIMMTDNILLITFDHKILKYDRKKKEIMLLGSCGSFFLHYNSTKSAKM